MLLSSVARYSILFGGLVIAVIGIVQVKAQFERYLVVARQAALDGAAGRAPRFIVRRVLPFAAILVGIVIAWWAFSHNREYIIVTDDDDGQPSAVRRYGLDSANDLPIAPRENARNDSDDVWVLNRSSRTVRVETVYYGRSLGMGGEPTRIPPGTWAHATEIDHIGPGDSPPAQVTDRTTIGFAMRHWVTWSNEP